MINRRLIDRIYNNSFMFNYIFVMLGNYPSQGILGRVGEFTLPISSVLIWPQYLLKIKSDIKLI